MKIPELIVTQLRCSEQVDLGDVIIQILVRAGRKNPYRILFPKTDRSGRTELSRADFVGQFRDHWQEGLMDYDGSPETADPVVEVSLFDPSWLLQNRRLALAWPLLKHERTKWSSRKEEYKYRISCRNEQFSGTIISVNLETTCTFEYHVKWYGKERSSRSWLGWLLKT